MAYFLGDLRGFSQRNISCCPQMARDALTFSTIIRKKIGHEWLETHVICSRWSEKILKNVHHGCEMFWNIVDSNR